MGTDVLSQFKFTSPATGLEFTIDDRDGYSYIRHAITGDDIPILYDVEREMLMIPAYALKHIPLMTVSEAVKKTGLTRQHVNELARKGKFRSVKVGKRLTLIDSRSVESYVEGN